MIHIVLGIAAMTTGIAFLALEFNPSGLLVSSDNLALFLLIMFGAAVLIGLGAWSLSGYLLKMVLKPLLIVAAWTFLFALPILLLPLPADIAGLIVSLSILPMVLLYGKYIKWKSKRKGTTQSR